MDKRIIILCLFSCFSNFVYTQISYNKLIDTGYPQSEFYQMTVDSEDNIVGYGIGFSDTVEWKQGLIFSKLDSSGALLKSTFLLDSLGEPLAVDKHWGGIIETKNGGYAAIGATVGRESAFLIKLDQNLEVEFIKEYLDTINKSNFDYSLKETSQGFALYGSLQNPDLLKILFVRHVDKQGNQLWQRTLAKSDVAGRILDLKVWRDSILVVAYAKLLSFNPLTSEQSIEYLDLSGNTIKSRTWEMPSDMGYVVRVLPKEDGGLILYGDHLVEWIGSTQILQSLMTRFDNDLEIVWTKRFGKPQSINAAKILRGFDRTQDGNYIGAGEHIIKVGNEPSRRGGWFYHFSPNGDSLWFETITPPLPPIQGNSGFFGGVGVLSDGSVVAGGGADEGNQTSVWVVKVNCSDSLFCGEPIVGVDQIEEFTEEVLVYPNPAQDFVKIKTPEQFTPKYLTIVDYQGNWIQSDVVNPVKELLVDTKHLSSGIYFFQIMDENNQLLMVKVLISKS
jgi:hypothetical protein